MGVRPFRIALVAMSLIAGLLAGGAGFEASAGPDASNESARAVPGEIIVGLTDDGDVAPVARGVGATAVKPLLGGKAYVLSIPGDPFGVAAQARGLSGVRYAEPNYVRTLHATPNDPDFGLKWDLHNDGLLSDGSDTPTAGADIDFLAAYDALQNTTFSNTIVAILDTGIDGSHPDLNDKLVTGYDAFDGDNNPADGFGHGTHVAGIAAAETNNSTGTAGVGFPSAVKIMPVKVCDDNGSCPTSAIVDGVTFAIANGARVINMSFGSSERSQTEEDAFDAAYAAGLLLVASAGNSNVETMNYPAAYEPAVMAIAATDWDDSKASYSNYGKSWVDLAAPGGDMDKYDDPEGIYSTMPTYNVYLTSCRARGLLSPCYDQNYDQLAGTSMAAPQVAGAAGLLFAVNSSLKGSDVRTILETTADPIAGTDSLWANGRLDLDNAVSAADDGNAAPTASFTHLCTDLSCDFTDTSTDDGTIASWAWDFGDGNTSTDQNPSHPYTAEGTYTVTLTVTDDEGKSSSASENITVDDGINNAPEASFTSSCTALSCDFDGSGSSDSDGTIVSYDWDFGDENTSTGQNSSHTYGAEGTYTVTLTVTDDAGETNSSSQSVTVTEPSAVSLSVSFYKVRGVQHADLTWDGATSTDVDVYRNGSLVTTTANDGFYTDSTGQRGGGSATYQVCEAGTTTCSNEVSGSW